MGGMRRRSKGKKGVFQHDHQQQKKPAESSDNDLFVGNNTNSSSIPRLLSMGKSNPQLLNGAIRIALSAGMAGLIIGYHSGIAYSVLRYSHFEFRKKAPTTWLRIDETELKIMVTFGSTFAAVVSELIPIQRFSIGAGVMLFLLIPILHTIPSMLLCPVLNHERDRFGYFCKLPKNAASTHCRLYHLTAFNVMGPAAGFLFIGVPLYIAEVSPSSIRGALVSTFFLQIAAGQIIYFLIRCFTSIQIVGQLMLGVIPTVIYFALLHRLPDSPRFLYKVAMLYDQGEINHAVEIMRKIHPPHEADKELDSLRLSLESTKEAIDHHEEKISCFKTLQRLFPVVGCFLAQYLMGFNVVLYFTPTILVHLVGGRYDSDNSIFMPLLVISVLYAIGSVLCIAFIDRYGRRRLLLVSTLGIVACLGFCSYLFSGGGGDAMATAFIRRSNTITDDDCQAEWCTSIRSEEERGLPTGLFRFSALVALGLYFIFYSLGIGTIPWIINSEIHPLKFRNSCGAVAPGILWFLSPLLYVIYEDYLIKIYIAKTFLLSTLFAFATCVFIYLCVPETKGYRLEEIENKLLLHAYGCSTTCTSCPKQPKAGARKRYANSAKENEVAALKDGLGAALRGEFVNFMVEGNAKELLDSLQRGQHDGDVFVATIMI